MIFTSEMVHLTAVVLKERAEAVSRALLRVGAVQFNRLTEIEPELGGRLHEASVNERRLALVETRRRIEHLLRIGESAPPTVVGLEDGATDVNVDDINGRIDRLARDVERFRSKQGEIQRQINRVQDVRRQLAAASQAGDAALISTRIGSGDADARSRFLDVRYGRVNEARLASMDREVGRLSGLVIEVGENGPDRSVFVISMKRNASEVERVLSEHGFRREELPGAPTGEGVNALEEADERISRLRAEQEEQADRIRAIVRDRGPELEREWRTLRVVELLLTIRGESSESNHATVFAGWVPRHTRDKVEEAVRQAAGGACHLEWRSADEVQDVSRAGARGRIRVPVELRSPRFLRPFQMLVRNFGVPEYRTIDPTPIVAIAYLLMFGLMFGDAGHGLVLVVLGVVGGRLFTSPGYRQISRLLVWCGGASVVMGVLFGAYFGLELLPPLWFNYHGVVAGHAEAGPVRNLMDILTITIYFGIAVIGAGLVMNWINRVRKREWLELVFEKEGVLGGIIYASGVWVAAVFARSGFQTLPDLSIAGPLIAGPALLLFLKFPIEAAHTRRHGERAASPAMWVMDWVIELLEVFSGYLANTLSFMRVAGLGIAHVMLMVAFFQIAEMISPGGVSIVSVIVLVLGNALVIALEGLSAGIQSLRLNYYEFFSKYFNPTGVEYRPVSLHNTVQGG
jgi:V/A-type H+-transporting ATPase subunit I